MPIVWTEGARKALPSRTREQASPPPVGDAKTIWEAVRKSFAMRNKWDPIEATFVKGRSLTTPELAALMEKCQTIVSVDEPPVLEDRDVAGALAAMIVKHAYNRGVPLLRASLPTAKAFAAHVRSREFAVVPRWASGNDPFRLVAAPPESEHVDVEWRDIVLAAPDEVHAECKEIARAAWPSANLGLRTTLAYTFFEEIDWCNEACRAWLGSAARKPAALNVIVTDFELAQKLVAHKNSAWNYLPLLDRFGDAMLPVLVAMADAPFDRWHARNVAEALAMFDDPAAAVPMAKLLAQASSRPHALEYFARFPHFAETALASIGSIKGRAAKIAREVLTGAHRAASNPIAAEDEASPGDLPRVLASPPWLEEDKPKKPTTKLALERIDVPEAIDWPAGEKARALKWFTVPEKPATEETLADYAKMRADGKYVDFVKHKNEALPDALVLEAWNSGQKTWYGVLAKKLPFVLAKYGDAAFPGLPYFVEHLASGYGGAPFLLEVRSWRLALPLAKHIEHKRIGKVAWQWLQKHAELAVLTLVPVAFGDDKTARGNAERALFRLRASGVDVTSIGARYGEKARAALEKLFSWDPVYDLPKTMPKLADAFRPETLTRPRLVSGKALPLDAVTTIAGMLTISPIDPPYAGLLAVKEACEPRGLAELAWEMARAWEHAGHKKKDIWMLMSLVHFADDEVVRRLTPGVRPDFAVQVLEAIGSDAALMEMATIAGRSSTYDQRIELLLEQAAAERGVTKDELEEDLAPTSELDESGALILDYGARKLEVGFDECLVPYVKNDAGVRARALPPARKTDDAAKVERAKSIWRDLKEDVSVIASRRIRALERGMTSGRTWTEERFRRVWLDHRLMKHLARGVVWAEISGGERGTAFRVAEDGTLSDSSDSPFALSGGAKIGVAHPLHFSADEIKRWRTVLDDYGITQPFSQLGREYVALDAAATRVPWPYAAGDVVYGDFITRLAHRGFHRGPHLQGKYTYRRQLQRGGLVQIEFKVQKQLASEIAVVFLNDDKEVPLSQLDRIDVADAVYELQG
ncbi:MAG TPA: DUF4132 domain-containing protein [Polyangiaceae bacterium]